MTEFLRSWLLDRQYLNYWTECERLYIQLVGPYRHAVFSITLIHLFGDEIWISDELPIPRPMESYEGITIVTIRESSIGNI
jgi:hypothetical protein